MLQYGTSSQLPENVKKAIQLVLREECEKREWSTYQLAAQLGVSQSTAYTAVEYGKCGTLFANKVLSWLKTDIETLLNKYSLSTAPVVEQVPVVRAIGAKMKWHSVTISQIELLFRASNQAMSQAQIKQIGGMFNVVNLQVLQGD